MAGVLGNDLDINYGGPGAGNGTFGSIADMTFSPAGLLHVLDATRDGITGNNLVQVLQPALAGAAASPTFLRQFSAGASGVPSRIAVDTGGTVYLAVPSAGKVDIYGPTGTLLASPALAGVVDVAFGVGGVYALTATGIYLYSAGAFGAVTLGTLFTGATGIAVGLTGSFYVLANTNQLYKYSSAGTLLASLGSGTNTGTANPPAEYTRTLSIGADGSLYVGTNGQTISVCQFDPGLTEVRSRKPLHVDGTNYSITFGGTIYQIPLAVEPATGLLWMASNITDGVPSNAPVVSRVDSLYFAATSAGVMVTPNYLIGLTQLLTCGLNYGQQTGLAPVTFTYSIAAAQFRVHALSFRWYAYDENKIVIATGTFSATLTDGSAYSNTFAFTPLRYGHYTVVCTPTATETLPGMSVTSGVVLPGAAYFLGITPAYSNMRTLAAGDGGSSLDSTALSQWCGIGLYRAMIKSTVTPASLASACSAAVAGGQNVVVAFEAASDCTQANINAAVTNLDSYASAYEFVNEPNFTLSISAEVANRSQCRTWLRSAGSIKPCIGPGYVSMAFSRMDTLITAGGHTALDGWSTHDYQGNEHIEKAHWDYTIAANQGRLSTAGKSGMQIWMTERAITAAENNVTILPYQTHRLLLHRMIWETHGADTKHVHHYYPQDQGFNIQSFLFSASGCHPAAVALRTRYSLLGGLSALSAYTRTLDFGTNGNELIFGVQHTAASGASVISLLNMGTDTTPVMLTIAGGGTVTLTDVWGNQSTLTPGAGGAMTVSVNYPIVYLSLSAGQSVVPAAINFGTNLAGTATVTWTGTTNGQPLAQIVNGLLENLQEADPNGTLTILNMVSQTETLDFTLASAQTISRIVEYGHEGDNVIGNLLSADYLWWDGSAWHPLAQPRRNCPATTLAFSATARAVQWGDCRCIEVMTFTPVTTTKIRMIARRATQGLWDDDIANNAAQINIGREFGLRDVRIYA